MSGTSAVMRTDPTYTFIGEEANEVYIHCYLG